VTTQQITDSAVRGAHEVRVVVGRMRRRLRELADPQDLTPSQTSVLSRLDKQGPASASDLAVAEQVRPQSMAATVAALVERGLVERRPDPRDGRRQLLVLTAQAHDLIAGNRQAREEWLARMLQERCTEDERRTILDAMRLLDGLVQA